MPQLIILGATPQRTYITTANSAATTATYTFSGVSIGPASPDRYVVGCFYTSTAVGGRTRTAVSIGGSAATVVAESNTQITATNTGIATIAGQAIPSGTTADFSITYNNNMTGCILFVYILNNLASTTAFDTDAIVIDSLSVFTSKTVTLDIPGGVSRQSAEPIGVDWVFDHIHQSARRSGNELLACRCVVVMTYRG
jgi:hypothetical protein